MLLESGERPPAPPVPPLGKLAGRGAVRRGLCPRPGPPPKIRSRERARGRGLVCFARRRPGIGVRPCKPPGPRLRAQRLEGLAGAAGVFHREEKVTRGRGRESRGRGLTTPERGSGPDASGHRVLGLSCFRLPCPRRPVCRGPLKSVWVLWPGASQGSGREVLRLRSSMASPPHSSPSLHTTHCGPGFSTVVNVFLAHSLGWEVLLSSPAPWAGLRRSVCAGTRPSAHTHFRQALAAAVYGAEYSGSPGNGAQPPAY